MDPVMKKRKQETFKVSDRDKNPRQKQSKKGTKLIKNSILFWLIVALFITITFSLAYGAGIIHFPGNSPSSGNEESTPPTATLSPEPTPIPTPDLSAKVVLSAIGDIILHESVRNGGLKEDGSYQYDYLFASVTEVFQEADYVIANFEGAMNGPPYLAYPFFNYPDEIAVAIRDAGIGMVTTANNHAFDRGVSGLKRTAEVFREIGVEVVGTRSDPQDPITRILEIHGIKIAFAGYSYETPGTEGGKAINGLSMPSSAHDLIDSFNPYRRERFESDKRQMAQRIQEMREEGAECIVFNIHWGDEYKTRSNSYQRELAYFLADEGVDIIFGHHPHVIQEIEVIYSAKRGKNTLVYYSLGNFIANMVYSTHGTNGYAEDALIAMAEVTRSSDGKISVTKGEYVATYIYKERLDNRILHRAVPLGRALADPAGYRIEENRKLFEDSINRVAAVLSSQTGDHNGTAVGSYPDP
jgi:poly-gamma-glutamate capsule biosynthesis protein CapA/YwtB (metallophosphatase superfamily)